MVGQNLFRLRKIKKTRSEIKTGKDFPVLEFAGKETKKKSRAYRG